MAVVIGQAEFDITLDAGNVHGAGSEIRLYSTPNFQFWANLMDVPAHQSNSAQLPTRGSLFFDQMSFQVPA